MISHDRYPETRDALDLRWGALFERLGFLPIVLPTGFDFHRYFEILRIDGIILSGGNDLSSLSDDPLSARRDAFEKPLIACALERRIPLFGICRGMQIIADYFHSGFIRIDGHAGRRHPLIASKDSDFVDDIRMLADVNSYHQYAVRNVPEGFIVSATSDDGTIEAMEHKQRAIFGQMWHTEREDPPLEAELRIIRKFFHA